MHLTGDLPPPESITCLCRLCNVTLARVSPLPVTTVYVRKEEEKVYNALLMDSLTVHDFKLQVLRPYLVHVYRALIPSM